MKGLYRIENQEIGLALFQNPQAVTGAGGGECQETVVEHTQALRPVPNLGEGLLAREIDACAPLLCQTARQLEQQGGFADAGRTSQQHSPASDQAASEKPVQGLLSGWHPRFLLHVDAVQGNGAGGIHGRYALSARVRKAAALLQGVPCLALGALPTPLRGLGAALIADVYVSFFNHQAWSGST